MTEKLTAEQIEQMGDALLKEDAAKKAPIITKKLGRSIEERPESVELRNEFGHWEIDSVLGLKNENEPVRFYRFFTLVDHSYFSIFISKISNDELGYVVFINSIIAHCFSPFCSINDNLAA